MIIMNELEFDISLFLSKANFSEHIENLVLANPGMTYFEAVLYYSEEANKEPEELIKCMSTVMIEKVRQSAIDMELIQPQTYDINEL